MTGELARYEELLEAFVAQSRDMLGEKLTGVYLHGSAVMGCFSAARSDLDLLVVVKAPMTEEERRAYLDMVVRLNRQAPPKGIEMSVVRSDVCSPFVYPTPFELHFSIAHLPLYEADPARYLEIMRGTDRDLAAHITILRQRGWALWGQPVAEVFSEVPPEDYLDSIWADIGGAEADIAGEPVYVVLNLCRVLAWCRDGLVLSKEEGGRWALDHLTDAAHRALVASALAAYERGTPVTMTEALGKDFARTMLAQIRAAAGGALR